MTGLFRRGIENKGSEKLKKSLFTGVALSALLAVSGGAWADVLVGVGAPMTGPNATYGAQILKGAEAAIAEINANGGMNGEQIKIVIGDDVSDPKQGISVANKFAGDGVQFVIGPYNSGVAIPAADVYAENGILMISPGATNPAYTEKGLWNVFRTCGRDDQQGIVAGEYIAKHFKDKKIAVVHDKTPYGQGLADATKKKFNELGVKEVLYEGVNVGEKDFSALITKAKAAGVEAIYWGGVHTEGGLLIRQLAENNLKVPVISGDAIVNNELASIAGDAVIGTLNTFGPDPRVDPANKELVEKFRAAGFEPEAYTIYSYAAAQAIAAAAAAAGSNDPQQVAAALKEKGPFPTALGALSFDAKGDAELPGYVMYEWKKNADGNYVYEQQVLAD
ncbi:Leu/Ile/Val-binding protein [Paenochrobactrum sp. BZR 201-1]